jgi:hypothetical protein
VCCCFSIKKCIQTPLLSENKRKMKRGRKKVRNE